VAESVRSSFVKEWNMKDVPLIIKDFLSGTDRLFVFFHMVGSMFGSERKGVESQ